MLSFTGVETEAQSRKEGDSAEVTKGVTQGPETVSTNSESLVLFTTLSL